MKAAVGEPAEPGTGPLPPGQDCVRQAEFGGLFDGRAIRILGAVLRVCEGSGHRQVSAERGILQIGHQPTGSLRAGLIELRSPGHGAAIRCAG